MVGSAGGVVDGGGEGVGGGPAAGVPAVAGGGAAGFAGTGGAAGDPGECVSGGAAAGYGVGGVFGDSSHGDTLRVRCVSQCRRNSRPAGVLRKWRLVPRVCFAKVTSVSGIGKVRITRYLLSPA